MFEVVETHQKLSKDSFSEAIPDLRLRLLQAQREARKQKLPILVIIAGVSAAGKGEIVNRLNEWLDVRDMQIHAFDVPTDEERERPRLWRFWRELPPRGSLAIMFGAWYRTPIVDKAFNRIDNAAFDDEMQRIRRLEKMLVRDGMLVVKFWCHLSQESQQKRIRKLQKSPDTSWRLSQTSLDHAEHYDDFIRVCERGLRLTDNAESPWILVNCEDPNYRDHFIGSQLASRILTRLAENELTNTTSHKTIITPASTITVLDEVDLEQTVSKSSYEKQLLKLQARLHELSWDAFEQKLSTVLVFEGWDAAGKGGCIRRVSQALDARLMRAISIAAPSDEEKAQHYLWRFWRHIPRAGRFTIYDRSWYGRVLVEAVEKLTPPERWQRGYEEINDFEEQLFEHQTEVIKFWLHISPQEQLKRFEQRKETPYKQHKLTDEDWRNREKWPLYAEAVHQMVAHTSTEFAPWHLIAANDKRHARLSVLQTIIQRLENRLEMAE